MRKKNILLLGAGLSSAVLIQYLLEECEKHDWHLTIADKEENRVPAEVRQNSSVEVLGIDIRKENDLAELIKSSNLVISMVPAGFHDLVAKICLECGRSILTASYVTEAMRNLGPQFKEKGLLLLGEIGLDPGIDHMSAMKIINRIREEGSELTVFETFTGGLLAPTNDDNPWHYKFTWNPRNVVLAGQGVVKFLQEGRFKYIPYHRLFRRTEVVHIPEYGYFEGYANRDSLKYREIYGLQNIKTLYRGTFRMPGFCKAWDVFVQLGATDDSYQLEDVSNLTHRQFINLFLSFNPDDSVELKLAHYMSIGMESEEMYKLKWLGIFQDELIGLDKGTPAQILEHILKKKWSMNEEERDMIVMWHKFAFDRNGQSEQLQYHMVVIGDDSSRTAMAKTVGLPLGIAAKLVLEKQITTTGVHLPILPEIYRPILKELETRGITFREIAKNQKTK